MILKNKNFISPLMTKKDLLRAFECKNVEELIDTGLIKRYYQYFKPTVELWKMTVPDTIEIIDVKRINGLDHFWYSTIEEIFECDLNIAKVIADRYFVRNSYGYYKRSDELNKLLAEGEIILLLKEKKNDNPNI